MKDLKSAFGGYIDESYCRQLQGIWVDSYKKEDGTRVQGYCRKHENRKPRHRRTFTDGTHTVVAKNEIDAMDKMKRQR